MYCHVYAATYSWLCFESHPLVWKYNCQAAGLYSRSGSFLDRGAVLPPHTSAQYSIGLTYMVVQPYLASSGSGFYILIPEIGINFVLFCDRVMLPQPTGNISPPPSPPSHLPLKKAVVDSAMEMEWPHLAAIDGFFHWSTNMSKQLCPICMTAIILLGFIIIMNQSTRSSATPQFPQSLNSVQHIT